MRISPTPLKAIAKLIDAEVIGDPESLVTGFNEIHRVEKGDVVFVDHPKYYEKALDCPASFVIINKKMDAPAGKSLLFHPEPLTAFNALTKHFNPHTYPSSNISATAKIGKNVKIMPGVVIGEHVVIGDDCIIHPNVVIYEQTIIGKGVLIHAGTVIGSDAFYFKDRGDSYEPLNSCGHVIIGDHVVIGANCTVDRGVSHETVIGNNSVLDNMVHIGHDVRIGEKCLFAAQVGIAGCVVIGNNVKIWGQVGITSSIHIADNVTIYAQSGITENLQDGKTYFGSPAGEAKEKMKELFALKQLPDLIKKLY